MGNQLASCTILLALAISACGEREPAPPAVSTERSATPSAPTPVDPRCLALCEHSGACLDARGEARGEERDCAVSCQPGGLYAAMPEAALGCSGHEDCAALEACSGAVLEAILGAPSAPAPEPSARPAPSGWPEGFPTIPGGTPLPSSEGDPLTLARVAYAGSPEGVESLLRAELARTGWDLDASTADDGALRFFARRAGTEIGVSVYRDSPDRSVVQLFGFQVPVPAP